MSTAESGSKRPVSTNGAVAVADPNAEGPNPTRLEPSRSPSLASSDHVFLLLVGFRLLNALSVQTFFQPDEYFQALEPAWRFAFGEEGGAWMTWEWTAHLRSAIHPALFALCYRAADTVGALLDLDDRTLSEWLVVAPKTTQALFAAATDFFTWRLASSIYGRSSTATAATLLLTIVSPWQWFCSTRTFSNSLETTLTVVALYNWPWQWAATGNKDDTKQKGQADEVTRVRRALLCAAVATVLRPTNILVWASLTVLTFVHGRWSLGPSRAECVVFVRETVLCGSSVLALSVLVDRIFYDVWVFPPWNFLHVNVVQSVATFYGNNDWHYYLSQGYPLLLMTALPFTLVGLFQTLTSKNNIADARGRNALRLLSIVCLLVPAAFSNIAHKEVRFIYPLLPALHVVTGLPLASFFGSTTTFRLPKKLLLLVLLVSNVSFSYYVTRVHNLGVVEVTHYLRHEFEDAYARAHVPRTNMSVGMLMPCHSTPWRSHLQHPPSADRTGIQGWALTCEPPLDFSETEKTTYLDEADQFYADPSLWLKKNMSRQRPRRKAGARATTSGADKRTLADHDENFWSTRRGRRPWPDYLVFFEHLEPTLQVTLRGSGYLECHRFFNSHWHDDHRRTGDVVVWCLDEGRTPAASGGSPPEPPERAEQPLQNDPNAAGAEGEWPGHLRYQGESPYVEEAEAPPSPPSPSPSSDAAPKKYKTKRSPVTRVVEKPFWKAREPEE